MTPLSTKKFTHTARSGSLLLRFVPLLVMALSVLSRPVAAGAQSSTTPTDTLLMNRLKKDWGVKFSSNNSIVIFKTGQEKFDDLFAAVRQAKSSVHLEYFNFRNDSISKELFTILAERAAKGVKVRAIFDAFGNSSNDSPLKSRHLDSLHARGIEIHKFDPLIFPWINHAFHRDHRKIVVIDGCIAYTGGMNVADYYITGKPEFGEWRDIHARLTGDVVGELQAVFMKHWKLTTGEQLSGTQYYPGEKNAMDFFTGLKPDTARTAGHKTVGVTDRDPKSSPRIIHDTFIRCIDEAKTQIQIINPYFTLCRHVKKALKRAARRGVDVQVMVSEKCDIPVSPRIVEYNVKALMDAGADIYFFQGGFHHSKVMMIDGICSYIGSANLNSRSLSFDYECNLFIADRPTTETLQRIFEHDKTTRCFRLTPEVWKSFSKWRRFKGWLFHFLIPFVKNGGDELQEQLNAPGPCAIRHFQS